MIPYHVYYLLTAMGCLWLCIMLHHGWPRRSSVGSVANYQKQES